MSAQTNAPTETEGEIPILERRALLTDDVLAEYFVEHSREIVFFHKPRNTVYVYEEDKCLYVHHHDLIYIGRIAVNIIKPYIKRTDPLNKTRRLLTLCSSSGASKFGRAIIKILPDQSKFINETFNRLNLFPFGDKVVDFGKSVHDEEFIRLRRRTDFFTYTTSNEYLGKDFDNSWLIQHAREILQTEDMDYIRFFYKTMAYGLTNDNTAKKFVCWFGRTRGGGGGKTATMNLYKEVCQDACCPDSDDSLYYKSRR
jgi:hypothetical protein